jgi:formate dehydrogenase subunit gamma
MAASLAHYLRVGRRRAHVPGSEAAGTGREIVRYTLLERAVHWTVALSFLYLALTGLGLFTPKLAWLLAVFGGGQVVRAWHPIAGLAFTAAVLYQFINWFRDLKITPDDRLWLERARDYIAGRDDRVPASGRFNAGQKLLFWVQAALSLMLFASGILVWFPEAFPRSLRLWALLIHSASAAGAVLAIVIHIYMAVFVTEGALRAMVEGKVSEEWARRHHGKWAESSPRGDQGGRSEKLR